MEKKNDPGKEEPLTADQVLGDTEASKIWKEIKDRPIGMFGLPNQIVSQYCIPKPIEPSKLYLLTTASAVLPALEAALGDQYVVELAGKFVSVARHIDLFAGKK
jgi:hypothetical protein